MKFIKSALAVHVILQFILFSPCFAQSNVGTADFAMLHPKWPCTAAQESEKNLPELRKSILWNTFGNDTACLLSYLNNPKLTLLEIHLINEPCHRNNQCGPYEFLNDMSVSEYNSRLKERDPKLISKLKEYLTAPSTFIEKNLKPHTACLISPGLESNLSTEAVNVLIEVVKPLFPKCQIVWNPAGINKQAKPIPGTFFELHGSEVNLSPPCVASLDGEDIYFKRRPALLPNFLDSTGIPDYIERNKACLANFLWVAETNGLTADSFEDPRKRARFPTPATFDLLNRLISRSYNSKN